VKMLDQWITEHYTKQSMTHHMEHRPHRINPGKKSEKEARTK
jgi:hypothetical protein